MKVLLSAFWVSAALVGLSNAGGGKHHMFVRNHVRAIEDCAHTAGVTNETITKMREALKAGATDPQKLKERFHQGKFAEEMKAVVKEAESDKSEAFDACVVAHEDKMLMRVSWLACANSTGVSAEGIAKVKTLVVNAKSSSEKDPRKVHKQLHEDAKKALEETDKDKLEAYEKCLTEVSAKFQHKKKHGHEKPSEPKPEEEPRPADD